MKKNVAEKMDWQTLVAAVGTALVVGFLFLFRLGSLTREHLSLGERVSHLHDESFHGLLHNPINAPYKLLDFILLRILPHNAPFARLSAVVLALTACTLFCIIMYRWHGRRSAFLATALFSTSGWLLHVGRLGNGNATLVIIPLALILFASWLNTTERHGPALLYMTAASAVALFTPGAVWFLAITYLLVWKAIINHLAHARVWEKSVSVIVLLCVTVMLVSVIYQSPHLARDWLGLPATIPAPRNILKNWLDSAAFLFVRGPYAPDMWLAHAPIFDIFTTVMFALGGYFYATHYRNLRSHVLVAFLALGSVLVALNGATAMSYIVPVAYLIVGTGITYFLHRWLKVFPRNPVARSLGIAFLGIVVLCVMAYHITSYFIAWRYDPTTIGAFRELP